MRVACERFSGGMQVAIGDAVLRFDAEGVCEGIVAFAGGQVLDTPAPLRPGDIERLRAMGCEVEEDEDGASPPQPPSPSGKRGENDDGARSGEGNREEGAGDGLDAMNRNQLRAAAKATGVAIRVGMTNDDLRQAIREAGD